MYCGNYVVTTHRFLTKSLKVHFFFQIQEGWCHFSGLDKSQNANHLPRAHVTWAVGDCGPHCYMFLKLQGGQIAVVDTAADQDPGDSPHS